MSKKRRPMKEIRAEVAARVRAGEPTPAAPKPYVPKVGRPTKMIPETVSELCLAYKALGNLEDSARACGLHVATVCNWKVQARKDIAAGKRTTFVEFLEALQNAEREHKRFLITCIDKASTKQWQAAAWRLERRYGREYAPPVARVHVEGQLNEALDAIERLHLPAGLTEEQIKERVLSAIAGAAGDRETQHEESGAGEAGRGEPDAGSGEVILSAPGQPAPE